MKTQYSVTCWAKLKVSHTQEKCTLTTSFLKIRTQNIDVHGRQTQVAKNLALNFNLSREIQLKNHEIPFYTYPNLKTK